MTNHIYFTLPVTISQMLHVNSAIPGSSILLQHFKLQGFVESIKTGLIDVFGYLEALFQATVNIQHLALKLLIAPVKCATLFTN